MKEALKETHFFPFSLIDQLVASAEDRAALEDAAAAVHAPSILSRSPRVPMGAPRPRRARVCALRSCIYSNCKQNCISKLKSCLH